MNSERLPECRCLLCNHKLNDGFEVSSRDRPRPGMLTVCIYCGAVMMFAEDLTVRGLTQDEMDGLTNDEAAMKKISGMVQAIRSMPKMN